LRHATQAFLRAGRITSKRSINGRRMNGARPAHP
jgi:hypothetical protein